LVWNNDAYEFLEKETPNSANPSLWRQSQLNSMDGLFKVVDNVYQVRGLDISNVTMIEGNQGIIVIDPLTCMETAQAAYELYQQHRGKRPVKAVIYTNSHTDHFGGVRGFITDEKQAKQDGVRIFAPQGFLKNAVSENVFAGVAMSRRSAYMYGAALEPGPHSQIGTGIGQTTSTGLVTLIAPTDIIKETGHHEVVDGVKIEFQMATDTEAPSEMLMYFPDFKALCAAGNATHTFHNLLTLRGAAVRDSHGWARCLTEAIDMFGGKAEVVFASHHWPMWGSEKVVEFLSTQRDLYAYVHDQTLRMINNGLNGPEIAEEMALPPMIDKAWGARGYYGSVSHNVKAIYQRILGWFDGNPSQLWQHIPVQKANRYVKLIGVERMVENAQKAFDEGDFRWAAEMLNHVIFADTTEPQAKSDDAKSKARSLLADTYEQLGFGAENGPWRNFFLSGAYELRHKNFGTPTDTTSNDILGQLTPEMVFDSMAIQIIGPKAWDEQISMDVMLTDTPHRYRVWLSNGALIYLKMKQSNNADVPVEAKTKADVTLEATTQSLPALIVYGLDHPKQLEKAGVKVIGGNPETLNRLNKLLDRGNPDFNIVTPRQNVH
jgi:alkyl sulfatase BDS1-like metallo-beta-lactamase superfamily hydrolase